MLKCSSHQTASGGILLAPTLQVGAITAKPLNYISQVFIKRLFVTAFRRGAARRALVRASLVSD